MSEVVRPGRSLPELASVVQWWGRNGEADLVNQFPKARLSTPGCWRCGWTVPPSAIESVEHDGEAWRISQGWLDRAHLITRHKHGLDLPCNLVPLCAWCHKFQPETEPGHEEAILAWMRCGLDCPEWFQLATNDFGERWGRREFVQKRVLLDESTRVLDQAPWLGEAVQASLSAYYEPDEELLA